MQRARDPEGGRDAEESRDAEQLFGAIELVILAGVDDVETGRPEGDCGGEPKDPRIELPAYGDPCRCGRDSETEAEDKVREGREAFGKRVEKDDSQGERRETEAEG